MSTEERIKEAARKLFTRKGFAATRTRDIAEEAGINLALLNYYYRSKEKLFEIVMLENLQKFFKGIVEMMNNQETTLEEKIEFFVSRYTHLLLEQPDMPLFVFSEMKANPDGLASKVGFKDALLKSHFVKQIQQESKKGKVPPPNPLHFLLNMISMTIFPFVASPLVQVIGNFNQTKFNAFINERRKLLPRWVMATLSVNNH